MSEEQRLPLTYQELEREIAGWFTCVTGEPRSHTHDPPQAAELLIGAEVRTGYLYRTLGYKSATAPEAALVAALRQDFEYVRQLVPGGSRLLWRRPIRLEQARIGRHLVRAISTRFVVPALPDNIFSTLRGHKRESDGTFVDLNEIKPGAYEARRA